MNPNIDLNAAAMGKKQDDTSQRERRNGKSEKMGGGRTTTTSQSRTRAGAGCLPLSPFKLRSSRVAAVECGEGKGERKGTQGEGREG